jgi:hypothetical protein
MWTEVQRFIPYEALAWPSLSIHFTIIGFKITEKIMLELLTDIRAHYQDICYCLTAGRCSHDRQDCSLYLRNMLQIKHQINLHALIFPSELLFQNMQAYLFSSFHATCLVKHDITSYGNYKSCSPYELCCSAVSLRVFSRKLTYSFESSQLCGLPQIAVKLSSGPETAASDGRWQDRR